MEQSYTAHYLKTYVWQGISIVMNLLAMFIVVPKLSELPTIYGIYSVVISFSIFFTYADMGFIGAGFKYASESYARNDLAEEIEITGFVCFILFMFLSICAFLFFLVAMEPQMFISNLTKPNEIRTASTLLIILALFSPVSAFQRILQVIYGIRVEGFINQRIQTAASVLKILSVFYFFRKGHYDIVGYFLFFQGMNLLACILAAAVAKKKYLYDYILFIRFFRFSKKMYARTKGLAFASLYSAITHIFYYELDLFVIGKLLGVEKVALYAIGFTLQSFVRNLFGTIYTPFFSRFNHFNGLDDDNGLRAMLQGIIVITLPLVVFPVISITLLMKPLVLCWVGNDYTLSILPAQLLILSYLYSFISYPAGIILMTQARMKALYISGSILPVIYWVGVAFTIGTFGIDSFAMNKFIAYTAINVMFFIIIVQLLKIEVAQFMRDILRPLLIPCAFLIGLLWYLNPIFPEDRHKTGKWTPV